MDMQRTEASHFRTTHWSLVVSAAGNSSDALEALCSAYWRPLYWHVRRLGHEETEAQDLTQTFFAHLLEKQVLNHADRRRGRFRTFLLTALRRFLINQWERDRAQKRGGGRRALSLNFENAEKNYQFEPSHDITAEKLFEQQWAVTLLENAFKQLEHQHHEAGKQVLYESLAPYLTQPGNETGYAQAAGQLGVTPAAVKMAVSRLRKQFSTLVVAEIRKTVTDEGEMAREIENLFRAFR